MSIDISSNLTQRFTTWSSWKSIYALKGSPFQYEDDGVTYTIWTYDESEVHICQIWKGTVPDLTATSYTQSQNDSDKSDFETNYKSGGNKPLSQLDTDGASIVRIKAAKKGWTYASLPIEFATSRLQSDTDSFYSKELDGTDRTGITLKIYDSSDTEITTPGILNANLATAVKTVVDFEPTYDYEVIGGTLRTISDITQNIRLWIIAVPDISVGSGGSKEMVGGINLNYLVPQNFYAIDGRVAKFLAYNATYHTSKLRFVFKYPAGTCQNLQINLELYRQ